MLLLSRADRRSFTREHVEVSLMVEEATETLLPLAEERGVTIETSVETLAEPFRRGTERISTGHAGVGLGLAIVKRITQATTGPLTLTPRASDGLRVTVRLPAAAAVS